ncbi:hypothetical protein EJB05_19123, partial [Eragrostis curvula]
MQTEKPALMAPASSTEHSGELVDRHQPAIAVVKRKRTKRPRHHPPASSASSSESTTTEEEDMAHCLILLAQGGSAVVDSRPSPQQPPAAAPSPPPPAAAPAPHHRERYTSRKYTEAATTADGVRAGFYVYECKTCNKCFPTFQALGGHRASHKKPRLPLPAADDHDIIANATINAVAAITNQKPPMMSPPLPPPPRVADIAVFPEVTTALSLNSHVAAAAGNSSSGNKLRGQALGGHMRRHRPLNAPPERAVTPAITVMDAKKESINLELDLNLPAPSDEPHPPVVLGLGQFNDGGNKPGLMLTTSALMAKWLKLACSMGIERAASKKDNWKLSIAAFY